MILRFFSLLIVTLMLRCHVADAFLSLRCAADAPLRQRLMPLLLIYMLFSMPRHYIALTLMLMLLPRHFISSSDYASHGLPVFAFADYFLSPLLSPLRCYA